MTNANPSTQLMDIATRIRGMREILGYIAAAHAGNWIITDAGELRLVGFADIPPETFYLVTDHGDPIVFGDTRILV